MTLHKQIFVFLLIVGACFFLICPAKGQFSVKPHIQIEYHLYQWYQSPKDVSRPPQNYNLRNVGQVLNILPGIGGGIMLGDQRHLVFSLDGMANYHPFSLDLADYNGMGAFALHTGAYFHIPVVVQNHYNPKTGEDISPTPFSFYSNRYYTPSRVTFFTIGGGIQWSSTNLYLHPVVPNKTFKFFRTYFAELRLRTQLPYSSIGWFIRGGYGPIQAMIFNAGISLNINDL